MAFNNEESHSGGIGPKYLEEDMAKNHDKMPLYQSPMYLFVILTISVIVAEMLIMICFHFLPPFPMVIGAVIDSLLLFILLLPIIYFFVFRPLKLHINKREKTEEALKLANEQLQCNITNRKQTEEKMQYFNTLLMSIRHINETLLRAKDEVELFREICRLLVKIEFIKAVWIGLKEGSFDIIPVAQKGFDEGFLTSVKIRLDDSTSHLCPVDMAIKTGEPINFWHVGDDSIKEPLKEELLKRGFESIIAIPLKHGEEVIGGLGVYSDRKYAFGDEEIKYLLEVANDIVVGLKSLKLENELKRSVENLQKTLNGTIEAISLMGEMRDPYTAGHERRVAQLACAIAKEIGMTEDQIEGIRVCAFLHDVGKIIVPAEILSKPSELNEYEYGIIKSHPTVGYDILKGLEFHWPVAQTILQHHEMLDGTGYPAGLKGEEIILEARILAVADVVEAMSGHRPYRAALGIDKALEEISRNKDVLYDAKAVDACMRLFMEKGFRFEGWVKQADCAK